MPLRPRATMRLQSSTIWGPGSRMLPTHGTVTSVFHLANAIRYGSQPDLVSWVRAAGSRSAFLAGAIDHAPAARFLLREGLASSTDVIHPSARLRAVAERADRKTLMSIAALLLELDPPVWLPLAVINGQVRYEVIPSVDIDSLGWLQPELEQLLVNAAPSEAHSTLALGIGRAAELVVLEALTRVCDSAIHVSGISDRFGFDIESTNGTRVRRWEVKGCTERTAGTFHLSRNEFEKGRAYGSAWKVVQVEFSAAAVVAEHVTAAHIAKVQELSTAEILALAPQDSDHFQWEVSALIAPPTHAWTPSSIEIPLSLDLPSFDTLGREVLEMRQMDGARQRMQ